MISISSVRHKYSDQFIEFPNWHVDSQSHAMILGPSGSGKTTLLHILSGLLQPTEGSVKIKNSDLKQLSSSGLDQFRRKNIGVIFQQPHLIRSLNVYDNVSLAIRLSRKKIPRTRVTEVLEQLGIAPLAKRKPSQLSQGQAQRVSIARGIIHEPDLLIADEPTASLDDVNCERVITSLKEIASNHQSTLVIATHDQRVKSHFENRLEL